MIPHFFRQWTRLSAARRGALIRAFPVMIAVRLWLWIVPLRFWSAHLKRMMTGSTLADENNSTAAITWAVERIGRVPHMTCLVQAIAGYTLLRRSGVESRIRIGVRRDADQLRAHAWLINARDEVLIGAQNGLSTFAAFDFDSNTDSTFLKSL